MLAPSNATQYSCLQVYFCDPADQDRYSASRNTSSKIDREKEKNVRVFADLRRILTQEVTTTYLQSFFNINEFIEQEQLNPEEVHLVLHSSDKLEQGIHPGRHRIPTAPDVSILLPIHVPVNSEQSIVCSARGSEDSNNLRFFLDYHRSYMPLMYLLFPHGTDGWSLETRSSTKATLAQYTKFHLLAWSTHTSVLHISNKLYQQYIVDCLGYSREFEN